MICYKSHLATSDFAVILRPTKPFWDFEVNVKLHLEYRYFNCIPALQRSDVLAKHSNLENLPRVEKIVDSRRCSDPRTTLALIPN